jgi:formylglycine-generating enzyme required for sulfatase activity
MWAKKKYAKFKITEPIFFHLSFIDKKPYFSFQETTDIILDSPNNTSGNTDDGEHLDLLPGWEITGDGVEGHARFSKLYATDLQGLRQPWDSNKKTSCPGAPLTIKLGYDDKGTYLYQGDIYIQQGALLGAECEKVISDQNFIKSGAAFNFGFPPPPNAEPTKPGANAQTVASPPAAAPITTPAPVVQGNPASSQTEPPKLSVQNAIAAPPARVGALASVAKGGPMVLVPAGEFVMGCAKSDQRCEEDEKPAHQVLLDAFYIDKYEVTQGEYNKCVSAGACHANNKDNVTPGDNQPAAYVNFEDATNYCFWAGKRLPTEAEWEKAARGTDKRIFPWGDKQPTCTFVVMWDEDFNKNEGCGRKAAWTVGSKPLGASPYGIMDMAGNLAEWVSDWYDKSYYASSPSHNPQGPGKGEGHVLRGGGWMSMPYMLHASDRNPALDKGGYETGFRCAKTP